MTFRPIPLVDLIEAPNPKQGSQPGNVIWVRPDELVVDDRYQRDLGPAGTARVREIAHAFDWRKFLPVIVSRRAGGGYAIIDGQHRAAAVLARADIKAIPAWCVDADLAEQAQIFLTINAEGARVNSGTIWYARAATGDVGAKALLELCNAAGIQILKSPLSITRRRFNQTVSPNAIDDARRAQGSAATRWALIVLRDAGEAAGRCFLTMRMIRALSILRKVNPTWANHGKEFAAALKGFDVEDSEARATIAARETGGSRQEFFLGYVRAHLLEKDRVTA